MAVNLVADQLLPRLVSEQSIRESTIPAKASQQRRRVEELNDEYGCHVRVHLVRRCSRQEGVLYQLFRHPQIVAVHTR